MVRIAAIVLVAALVASGACGSSPISPDGGADDAPPAQPTVTITQVARDTRFVTAEHMLASGEMQIGGEPFAEAMGRDLGGFSRDLVPADIYIDPNSQIFWIDLAGFSTGVESYEYSKQPMNGLAFEFGAGTSLVHAPLVGNLAARIQQFAASSNAAGTYVFPAGTYPANNPAGNVNPDGIGSGAANPLGWPGIVPITHAFASFDPAVAPTESAALRCSVTSDDNPNEPTAPLVSGDYECDATTLHLVDRAAQIESTITPAADGFATWKYGLWTINYLQAMHDATGAGVASVAESDLATVGAVGNTIVGDDGNGGATAAGTFIGSSDIEGFQAALLIQEVDARADDWLSRLTTVDGTTLSGFPSLAAALAYDHTSQLRWFPTQIAVTESADPSGFPLPAFAIGSSDSHLMDQLGLALGYAEIYALTDTANPSIGGSQTTRVYFDGDPFPGDDQLADGDPTLHDRALAMIRVAIVNLDRMHRDPATDLLVDDVGVTGITPIRGRTVSTLSAAYTVISLRTVLRSLSSQLELYSNNTPDTAVSRTPLDVLALHFPGDAARTFSARVRELIRAHAALLLDHLTDASGRAFAGWDVVTATSIDDSDTLDAHTAAIRGLFAGYLATGDTRYRDRAIAVYARLEATFYDADARIYTPTAGVATTVEFTALRFGLLQSALRDVYELVATRPGNEALALELESRIGRLNKLVLNGWDDRNRDKQLQWPDECVRVESGLPLGGLQMAERTLSGELGRFNDIGSAMGPPTSDREHDCVPEIDDAQLPATLANSITFSIARQQ